MNTIRAWLYAHIGSPVDRAVKGLQTAITRLESAAVHHEQEVAARIKAIEKSTVEKLAHDAERVRATKIAAKLRALVE